MLDPSRPSESIPLVSVIIPVYNRATYIQQAVRSVLDQTHGHVQVIVVDDGSTCDVLSPLEEFGSRVECYRKVNGGQASARNYGMTAARGEFVLFVDDDDLIEPNALETLLRALRTGNTSWAAGRFSFIDGAGDVLPREHHCYFESGDIYDRMIFNNLVGPPCTVLARVDAVKRVGGFDEARDLQLCEDYDLWLAMSREFPIAAVQERVARYRVYPGQGTRNWTRHYEAQIRMLEKQRTRLAPASSREFARAIARVQLEYGDTLYMHGRVREARCQWRKSTGGRLLQKTRISSRFLKSYLPQTMLSGLRASRHGWRALRLRYKF